MRKLAIYGSIGGESLQVSQLRQGLPAVPEGGNSPNYVGYSGYNSESQVAISPDRTKAALVTGSGGTMQLFRDLAEGDTFAAYDTPAAVYSGSLNTCAAGNSLAAFGGASSSYLMVFDWATISLKTLSVTGLGTVYGIAFSPDESKMAVVHRTAPYLRIYNTSDWTYVEPPTTGDRPGTNPIACCWSQDGTRLVVTTTTGSPYLSVHNASGVRLHAITNSSNAYQGYSLEPAEDGVSIYVGGLTANNPAKLFKFNTLTYVQTALPQPPGNVSSLALDKAEGYLYILHDRVSSSCLKRLKVSSPVALESVGDLERRVFSSAATLRIIERNTFTITGTVRSIDNLPVARVVRAYKRSSGLLMAQTTSNASTGDYSLILPDAGPYDVQFMSLDGELLNDLIFAYAQPSPVV